MEGWALRACNGLLSRGGKAEDVATGTMTRLPIHSDELTCNKANSVESEMAPRVLTTTFVFNQYSDRGGLVAYVIVLYIPLHSTRHRKQYFFFSFSPSCALVPASSSLRMTFAKMFDLATSDVGRSNRIYSEDEMQVIQSVMQDAEQLLEERRRLYELVARCKVALAPHRKLPVDVLRCIFAMLVEEEDQGIYIPFKQSSEDLIIPAAVVLTHVCSLWRHIALSSPELWNNISLEMDKHDRSVPFALELLSRACDLPINLELRLPIYRHGSGDSHIDFVHAVYQLTSNRSVQKLRLHTDGDFSPVVSPENMFIVGTFNGVRDLHLQFDDFSCWIFDQCTFPNLEALIFRTPNIGGSIHLPGVPWSQLRRLDLSTYIQDVPGILRLLSQCTLIEECKLLVIIFGLAMDPKIPLPNLRALEFKFLVEVSEDFVILDAFFSHLSLPTLRSLTVIEEDDIISSSRVMSPLARNLKLMAPQLHDLRFNMPIEEGEVHTLSEHMPSLHIATIYSE